MSEQFDLMGRPVTLNASLQDRLQSGELVMTMRSPTGGKGVSIDALILIDSPADAVWTVVNNPAVFAEFMPRTAKSEVRGTEGDATVCYIEVAMPFPLKNIWSEVLSVSEEFDDGAFQRRWTLKAGDYHHNNGGWLVRPWSEGYSLLGYAIDINTKMKVPDALLRKAQAGALPAVFEAIRQRSKTV